MTIGQEFTNHSCAPTPSRQRRTRLLTVRRGVGPTSSSYGSRHRYFRPAGDDLQVPVRLDAAVTVPRKLDSPLTRCSNEAETFSALAHHSGRSVTTTCTGQRPTAAPAASSKCCFRDAATCEPTEGASRAVGAVYRQATAARMSTSPSRP